VNVPQLREPNGLSGEGGGLLDKVGRSGEVGPASVDPRGNSNKV
jgi:hypothetical protein